MGRPKWEAHRKPTDVACPPEAHCVPTGSPPTLREKQHAATRDATRCHFFTHHTAWRDPARERRGGGRLVARAWPHCLHESSLEHLGCRDLLATFSRLPVKQTARRQSHAVTTTRSTPTRSPPPSRYAATSIIQSVSVAIDSDHEPNAPTVVWNVPDDGGAPQPLRRDVGFADEGGLQLGDDAYQ